MTKEAIKNDLYKIIDEQVNKACFLSLSNRSLLSGRYIYPCENNTLRNRLFGEDRTIKVEDYLLRKDVDFLAKHYKFKSLIENGYFNPYKSYRLSEYFVKTDTFNELDVIYRFLEKPVLKRNIVHIGNKGSGKTALQNCWLKENNTNLENNNVFWVRCDGHKLYRLWLDHQEVLKRREDIDQREFLEIGVERLVNISQYLDIQLLYVFAKYCMNENREFFSILNNKLQSSSPKFDYPVSRLNTSHTESANLIEKINEVRETILKTEASQRPEYSYAYDHVMRISLDSSQLEKRKWLAISRAFQNFLKEKGYWVLKIVDGVDNVHINDASSVRYYQYMIDMAFKFIRSRPEENHIHFMAMRERTFIDTIKHHPIQQDTHEYLEKLDIWHRAADFKQIIENRYEFAKNKAFREGDLYDRIAKEVIKSLEENINENHHNNARAFLYNKMSLISQVYYRIRQLDVERANIESHVKTLELRNRFLNGRLFLNTKKQWQDLNNELGLCCMNIFYFDKDKYICTNIGEWPGLVKTRILQLLIKYQRIGASKLSDYLREAFKYSNTLIKESINDLRAFGMIDSKYDGYLHYEISKKGERYLYSSYSEIDSLYYFALDTPLPNEFIKSELIWAHDNKYHTKTHFPKAAISTAVTFYLFLICANREENKKYKDQKNDLEQRYGFSHGSLELPFSTANTRKSIKEKIDHLIDVSESNEVEMIEQYVELLGKLKSHNK